MSIEIIKAGMQTSIQDRGRRGLMQWGIANSGAMDALSMTIANKLLGNPDNHPVLEICLIGPSLLFTQAMTIAISGAEFEVILHNNQGNLIITNNQSIPIKAGDKLIFGKRKQGARAYLAFTAELALSKVFDSYSTHFSANFGGYQGRALKAGDLIALHNCKLNVGTKNAIQYLPTYSGKYLLRCTDSVETDSFTQLQQRAFYKNTYTVSNASNRMGLRLEGLKLNNLKKIDITSSGLLPGSIQIPPNGLPIISSVDGQTIGGYPRIANVISTDLFALGQLVAGDTINFAKVSINQAHHLRAQKKQWLKEL